jgi:DNA-binding transcriptional regulator PaaX
MQFPTRNIILRTLATAGVLSVALVAPNAVQLFGLDAGKTHRKELYRRITQAIWRLEREGYVKSSGIHGKRKVILTTKGKRLIEKIFLKEYVIEEPVFWDGKWRVAIFDVTEKRRRVRSQLRTLLQGAGFYRLQDSVWVHPYQCDEYIQLLRAHLRSGTGEMRVFVAEALESDRTLREYFDLD